MLLSHTSHYASVLLLWRVTSQVFRSGAKIAFLTALLHIFSPGGIFLSAPYAESLFSFLSFAALAAYYRGVSTEKAADQAFVVLSGLLFGIACTVRSNGLFYGILFIPSLSQLRGGLQNIAAPAALICGGGLVAIGAISAQVLAYIEFCYMVPMSERAVWCANTIPSIYTYVQERYWQVGLFSYWKKANIPLFFLSSPLIAVLLMSGFRFSQDGGTLGQLHVQSRARGMLRRLGTIQLVLALLAISMYHIQIVMRIASGYPVWYWWLAEKLSGRAGVGSPKSDLMIWASRTIVAYGVIQAGLFATFLPPA